MNKQELAALLEVISFFFVGLDLYGKERLGKMQNNILELSDKIYERLSNAENFDWTHQRGSKFMKVIYLFAGTIELGGIVFLLIKIDYSELNFEWSQFHVYLFTAVLLAAVAFLFFGFIMFPILIALVVILVALIVSIRMVNLFLKFLIWAFKFYQIEGVFLFIGTILFIVSKYFQLY
jgi:hypothetical protein